MRPGASELQEVGHLTRQDQTHSLKRHEPENVPEVEPGLTTQEAEQVHSSRRLRAAVVYEIIRTEGEGELKRGFPALWWSGLAAGISIGFSFLSEAALAAHLPEAAWKTII